MDKRRLHLRVSGRVQGVGFRYFTQETADSLYLTGWVRNLPDGGVEIEAQGEVKALDAFCKEINEGPSLSYVKEFVKNEIPIENEEHEFSIVY